MRSVLITGGSGSFGRAFVRFLLSAEDGPARSRGLSRGEHAQAEMAQAMAPHDPGKRLGFFIGDVRDRDRLRRAMDGVEVVVHAAALKRIEVGAYNPTEMVKTNVIGAMNVIEAAFDAGVRKVVALSTDKACRPVSPYGQSKALAESLFLNANNTRGRAGPVFSVTRYGNVWCSAGSVVPRWREMLRAGCAAVPVTDPEATRFFMTMAEAVALVEDTIRTMSGGELRIPQLPAYRLADLAAAMGAKMNVTGLPAWEKRHEAMADDMSSDTARRMSVDELKDALRWHS